MFGNDFLYSIDKIFIYKDKQGFQFTEMKLPVVYSALVMSDDEDRVLTQ